MAQVAHISQAGRLTASQLKYLRSGMHSDGGGLYLNVQKSGSRSWILRTTVRGKRKELGLGGLSTTSLSDARKEAAELRARAKRGEDIVESRRLERHITPTFRDVSLLVHENLAATFTSAKHARNWLRSLEQYIFPAIGSKTVDAIDSADVCQAIGPVWKARPDTAQRILRRVRAIFDYCETAGHRDIMVDQLAVSLPNPCDEIKVTLPKHQTKRKHQEALRYQELAPLIEALRKTRSSLSVKLALEFTILTASRTSEVLNAKWDEFNFDNRSWTVTGTRMKSGKDHKVPLSARCLAILELARQFNDDDLVFPGRPGKPLSNMAMLMLLRRMGHQHLTVNGFRATFRTWAEERTKFESLVIEAALAHEVKGIERHYLGITFFEKRQELMDLWSGFASHSDMTVRRFLEGGNRKFVSPSL